MGAKISRVMSLFDLILGKVKRKKSIFTEKDIDNLSEIYRLPKEFIRKIDSVESDKRKKTLMMIGAMYFFKEKPLLGDKIPINDPLSLEIVQYLNERGVAIQYTHRYGMILVRTNNKYES